MIRGSIWTLPFDKIRFSQLNTTSAGIVSHCRFFSVRMEESPEVIVLDHVLIALNFSAKLCVFTFQIRCAELAANRLIIGNLLLQTVNLSLEFCNQFVCRIQRLLQFGFLFLCCNCLLYTSKIIGLPNKINVPQSVQNDFSANLSLIHI